MHQRQPRASVMQAVGRLVPPADEEHAELAAAGLDGSRKHAFGQFENGLRLHPELPFGYIIYQLFYNSAGFHDFIHAHHIAIESVPMRIGDFLKVHLAVHRVGMMFAHVVGPSGSTARPAGTAQRDSIKPTPFRRVRAMTLLVKISWYSWMILRKCTINSFVFRTKSGCRSACTPPITL